MEEAWNLVWKKKNIISFKRIHRVVPLPYKYADSSVFFPAKMLIIKNVSARPSQI